jgi:hypothetical protein
MRIKRVILDLSLPLAACLLFGAGAPRAHAYIDVPPHTLGHMCSYSTDIVVLRVEKVDKEKKVVFYRKVQELKGKWPAEVVRHHVVSKDVEPILQWAEPGKTAISFYVKTAHFASYTYIDGCWYISRLFCIDSKIIDDVGKWEAYWVRHSQLRTFSGKPDQLTTAVAAVLKGEEVVVPCLVADRIEDLAAGRGKAQKMRASLKRLDYNVKRDSAD